MKTIHNMVCRFSLPISGTKFHSHQGYWLLLDFSQAQACFILHEANPAHFSSSSPEFPSLKLQASDWRRCQTWCDLFSQWETIHHFIWKPIFLFLCSMKSTRSTLSVFNWLYTTCFSICVFCICSLMSSISKSDIHVVKLLHGSFENTRNSFHI